MPSHLSRIPSNGSHRQTRFAVNLCELRTQKMVYHVLFALCSLNNKLSLLNVWQGRIGLMSCQRGGTGLMQKKMCQCRMGLIDPHDFYMVLDIVYLLFSFQCLNLSLLPIQLLQIVQSNSNHPNDLD